MDGMDVIGYDYVTDNSGAYNVTRTYSKSGKTFGGWVNAGSNEISSVPAGNTENITLYASWTNSYTARFVDQHGNVIYSETFTNKTTSLNPPNPPAVTDCTGTWEDYKTMMKNAKGDITVHPVYTYSGNLELTPVDEDGNGSVDYYRVDAVASLPAEVVVPGYVNGVPVAEIDKLTDNRFATNVKSIVLEEGVEKLNVESLAGTGNLEYVSLPSTLETIEKKAFSSNVLGFAEKEVTFDFNGTKAQWDAIAKADGWDEGLATGATVRCTDGYYELSVSGFSYWKEYEWTWKSY